MTKEELQYCLDGNGDDKPADWFVEKGKDWDRQIQTIVQADIAYQLTEANELKKKEIAQLTRIADAIENRPILLTPEEMKPAPKLFISIPENKNREHTFRLCDLRSYRDYYFQYEPQGGFGSPLTAEEITDRIESAFELKPADAIGKE